MAVKEIIPWHDDKEYRTKEGEEALDQPNTIREHFLEYWIGKVYTPLGRTL